MRWVLVNPPWSFAGSTYFGCREVHLPLELAYGRALLEAAGVEAVLVDGHAAGWSVAQTAAAVLALEPDVVVMTTAPTYLFWRCPQPELRVPLALARALGGAGVSLVVVGPHGSASPGAVWRKLSAAYGGPVTVVGGECEEALAELATLPVARWAEVSGVLCGLGQRVTGGPRAVAMEGLPALRWSARELAGHGHHHHRFEGPFAGPGAELEASRGCPYRCSFCSKELYRNKYRKRPLAVVLAEVDGLLELGVTYLYFVDEIFLPDAELLRALAARRQGRVLHFGMQTRIDLWAPEVLALLGEAGCVSAECGVESISEAGRAALNKRCKLSTEELTARLVEARRYVPFVQANLLDSGDDDLAAIERWRAELLEVGVWANKPVPVFDYPASPGYVARWGAPDDLAWERAHEQYLRTAREFADFQDQAPLPLAELEHLDVAVG